MPRKNLARAAVQEARAAVSGTWLGHRLSRATLDRRDDPIPTGATFPDARYIILVGGIPRHYAGRTASILTKTRLWYETAGIESTIVAQFSSAELDDIAHGLREKGILAPGVQLASLHDFYPDDTSHDGPAIEHPLEEPGLRWIKEKEQPVYRFFDEHGVYRMYKRLDYDGRLIVRDWFNETRSRTRRDEFRADGTLKRTVYWGLETNKPRQDIFYSHSGVPLFNHWTTESADGLRMETQRVTHFDESGAPSRVEFGYEPVLHACLDNLVGDGLAFITGEARVTDETLLNYHRPNVRKLFVLHNAHITEPYLDVHKIRPVYQPMLSRRQDSDAIVFLTRTQRAEAEAHFGKEPKFRVIPHSAQEPTLDPTIARDLKRVIMMARLDQQKQVDQAIDAFKRVVAEVPDAKLDVYGRGVLQASLTAQIKRLGLQKSVTLKGYTTNPHAAYQGAGLCIMTSRYEGAPLTLLESLMHETPVISYDLKYGPVDIITDGLNGFLVPYGDTKAMAARIVQVLKDHELHERMIASSRLSAANFREDVFVQRWAGLFSSLADAPR